VDDQFHAPADLSPGKDPAPTVQEAGWATQPVWTGTENLALNPPLSPGFNPLYRPTCSVVAISTELSRLYDFHAYVSLL
jgi:hypothetical protein